MDTSTSYPTPTQFQTPSQFDFGSTGGAGHFQNPSAAGDIPSSASLLPQNSHFSSSNRIPIPQNQLWNPKRYNITHKEYANTQKQIKAQFQKLKDISNRLYNQTGWLLAADNFDFTKGTISPLPLEKEQRQMYK